MVNKESNPFYDATSSEFIYVDSDGEILPCRPLNPFTSYTDDFTVLVHHSGKIKLVGERFTVFKSENSGWNWCCTPRSRPKSDILADSINNKEYAVSTVVQNLSVFDFNAPPNI